MRSFAIICAARYSQSECCHPTMHALTCLHPCDLARACPFAWSSASLFRAIVVGGEAASESGAMPPKSSQPLPVGLVGDAHRTASADPSSSMDSTATVSPKPWYKGSRSKRRALLRAIAHHDTMEDAKFANISVDPYEGSPKVPQLPSEAFLQNAEKFMLARYCTFLLQMILLILRSWEPSGEVLMKFRKGCGTAARQALFWLQTTELHPACRHKMSTCKVHLYHQMLTDACNRDKMEATLKDEWMEDRAFNVKLKLRSLVEGDIADRIRNGDLPKTHIPSDFTKQWENEWEDFDGTHHRAIVLVRFHVSLQKQLSFMVGPKSMFHQGVCECCKGRGEVMGRGYIGEAGIEEFLVRQGGEAGRSLGVASGNVNGDR